MVDELARNGVGHVVLAPGSRSAPLAFALDEAARAGRLSLHVRVDERSAGFLALGLASRSGAPVAVVCTSGTAAANLHPAVGEAHHAGVPMVVLTADRPHELRSAGANQTIDQSRLYGTAVRWYDEMGVAENRPGYNAYWRSQVSRACHAADGGHRPGAPVHLNVPFREPLVPDGRPDWCEPLLGRADGGPWTRFGGVASPPAALRSVLSPRGLVLAASDQAVDAARWAERLGWPLVSESGGLGCGGPNVLATGMWLVNLPGFLAEHRPDQVLCVGRPTVFRQVQGLLADRGVEVLLVHDSTESWPAPAHDVAEVAGTLGERTVTPDPAWLTAWQQADHKAWAAVHTALDLERWPTGPALARDVVDSLPEGALLVLGSSNPARDVALAARQRGDVVVHRNRGVAGIDGLVSTAIGAAIAHSGAYAYALLGDLSFLHDGNGLLIGPDDERPDLTIVVFNDDGGGIFSLLEQGEPEHRAAFERVFGTPHGTDIGALCAAHGVGHVLVRDRDELAGTLRPRAGLRVVEVRGDREDVRGVHERLTSAVRSGVLGEPGGGPTPS